MTQLALDRAIEVAGGQSPLAAKLGIRQSLIWYWLHRSKKGVAAEYCMAIERETGVPAHELRPDIFVGSAPVKTKDGVPATSCHANPPAADLRESVR